MERNQILNFNDEIFEDGNLIDQLISQRSTLTADSRTLTADSSTLTADSIAQNNTFQENSNQPDNNLRNSFDILNDIHPQFDELGPVIEYENDAQIEPGNLANYVNENRLANENHLPIGLRTYNENNISEDYLGQMNLVCENCNAFYFQKEMTTQRRYTKCCNNTSNDNQIVIAQLEEPPQPLLDLFNGVHEYSTIFFNEIRNLNSVFSFTSMGVNLDQRYANARAGGFTFRISGSIYHRIGPLIPPTGEQPRFAQIFFYDDAESISRRQQIFQQIPVQLLRLLTECFNRFNPLLLQFRQIGLQYLNRNDNSNLRMIIRDNLPGLDRRRFNAPTAQHEIAAIIPEDNPEGAERNIIIRRQDNQLQNISETNVALDPLSYILLFPRGELGWNQSMTLRNQAKRLTLLKFARHRIHTRQNNFNIITKAKKLFQQYIVDIYVRIEKQRLDYIRFNQTRLRAELYQGLADAYRMSIEENYGAFNANQIGRFNVLPASFVGGPRFMTQLYQDAMALVRKFGRPDLFITMTCNPNWREIREQLRTNETSWDRPLLVNRVFKMKLDVLIKLLLEDNVLGLIISMIHVIEFQKRGLPHCHILLILDENSKIRTPEDIDRCVSAELPDQNEHPILFNLVSTLMMHRPCENNPNAVCKINGRCSKNFPKPFFERTVIDQGAYPKYKRRIDGPTIFINNQEVGNQYVVPYNKYLLKKLNCHVNVELCSNIQVVKYLYKYVYKGHDCATIQFVPNEERFNEVYKYVSTRYLSASEGVWRILSFPLHKENPNVYRLPVHLENHQQVVFRVDQNIQEILNSNRETKLTAWFNSNQNNIEGRRYLYAEYPEHFFYNTTLKRWQQRLNLARTVGRIYNVSPREGERFYLRLMLNHIRGATSFVDLRTVNGIIYDTYQQAAVALGILRSDNEYRNLMRDAILIQRPDLCRDLFAYILVFCLVQNANDLWMEFRRDLSEDIIYRYRNNQPPVTEEECFNLALLNIEVVLRVHNKRLDQYGLPEPNRQSNLAISNQVNIFDEELGFNTPQDVSEFEQMHANLTGDQRTIFNTILNAINGEHRRERRKLFFINAPGGTGKTFLLNTLLGAVRTIGNIALAVASSGLAALLLRNGRTAHSRFRIPLDINESSLCGIHMQEPLAELIRRTNLIVWDEAVMQHKFVFQCVDKTLRRIMNSNDPFGGKVVVFGGDFRQILPVVPLGGKNEIIAACMKYSYLWQDVRNLYLRQNLRANRNDPNFQHFTQFLERIGSGSITNALQQRQNFNNGESMVRVPRAIVSQASNLQEYVAEFYSDINNNPTNFRNTAILAPKNDEVDQLNEAVLRIFDPQQPITTYLSADSLGENENDDMQLNITTEFLNSINVSGLPPHRLNLKIGAIIILIRNLNPKKGLCNGVRMTVEQMHQHFIITRFINGQFINQIAFIPKITLTSSPQDRYPFIIHRHQFPVKLAFAMSINKAQGQSLDRVGVFLREEVFTHGQLYVALSRASTIGSIRLFLKDSRNTVETKNVVYREVLN